jgi:hypothetical protein
LYPRRGLSRTLGPNRLLRAFKAASTHTSVRPTGPLVASRGRTSCYPSPQLVLSAAPKGGGCGGILPAWLGRSRRGLPLGRKELPVGNAGHEDPLLFVGQVVSPPAVLPHKVVSLEMKVPSVKVLSTVAFALVLSSMVRLCSSSRASGRHGRHAIRLEQFPRVRLGASPIGVLGA